MPSVGNVVPFIGLYFVLYTSSKLSNDAQASVEFQPQSGDSVPLCSR